MKRQARAPAAWFLASALVAAWTTMAAGSGAAHAAPGRYALAIGNDTGGVDDAELRFAQSDARRLAEVLRTVGQFYPENIQVLANATAEDVRRAIIALNARIRQEAAPDSVLFIFYSGHADAQALHLGATRLQLDELRGLAVGSPAGARVLVLDACRAGALTRVKGATIREPFSVAVGQSHAPEGLVIMTSSTAGEEAQEFDQLRASVFTHHFISALRGAADRNGDGKITVGEAFSYASERTLAATARTTAGPQHPTYRFELGGRSDLVLAWPDEARGDHGQLVFTSPGTFFVQSDSADGPIVAELASDRPRARLAVPAGRYFVTLRGDSWLQQTAVVVTAGAISTIEPPRMERIEYARVVRKGGVARRSALSAVVLGGARGPLFDLGATARLDLGGRLDLQPVSLELRVGGGEALHHNDHQTIRTYETVLSLAVVHVFDLRPVSLGFGLEIGAAWLAQRFDAPATTARDSLAGILAPVSELELPVHRRVVVRLDASAPTYFVRRATDDGAIAARLCYRLLAGVGVSW
jgi:hypothetical protein